MSSPNTRSSALPVCIDHIEIFPSKNALHSIDHDLLPSSGPQRTARTHRRSSPYSSPHRSSSESTNSSSAESIASSRDRTPSVDDSSESEDEALSSSSPSSSPSPSRRRRRVFAYDSDGSDGSVGKARSPDNASARPKKTEAGKPQKGGSTSTNTSSLKKAEAEKPQKGSSTSTNPSGSKSGNTAGRKESPFITFDSDSDDDTIPRPPGEMGRPGRGGYNLCKALNWPSDRYDKVKKFINTVVEDKLDCTLPISEQALRRLEEVRVKIHEKYPFLKQYRSSWATDDFIRAHLKVRKAALHKEGLEDTLAEAEAVAEAQARTARKAKQSKGRRKQKGKSRAD